MNLAAQWLLGLPDQPAGSFARAGSRVTELFDFCRAACWSDEASFFAPGYVGADGIRWRVMAQRHGAQLVVSFTKVRAPAAFGEALPQPQPAALADDEVVRAWPVLH